jgi:hypothetical protein
VDCLVKELRAYLQSEACFARACARRQKKNIFSSDMGGNG